MSRMRGVERGALAKANKWFRHASAFTICITIGVLIIVLGTLSGFAIQYLPIQNENDSQLIVTTSAIIVAVLSVGVAAGSALNASRRQRRSDTMEAYSAWSDRSAENFEILRAHNCIQQQVLEEALVHCLLRPTDFTYEQRQELLNCTDENKIRHIRSTLAKTLNGLERIAVGVSDGVYDETTLKRIAGSAIIKTATQYRRYILAARYGAYGTKENPLAFVHLDQLVTELKAIFDEHGQERDYLLSETGRRH